MPWQRPWNWCNPLRRKIGREVFFRRSGPSRVIGSATQSFFSESSSILGSTTHMDITFCQRCLTANAVEASQCCCCGSKLVLPTIPSHFEGALGEFFEEEVIDRIAALEKQVSRLAVKVRDIFEINRQLVNGLGENRFKVSLLTGYFLRNQGHNQEAERYFEQSIRLNSRSVSAHIFLGMIALEKGKWQEAASFFERGLVIEESPLIHYMLAVAHYRAGRLGKALGALHKALHSDPRYTPACLLMANIAYKRGWKRKSETYLKRLLPPKAPTQSLAALGAGQLFDRQDENLVPQLLEDQSLVRYVLREIGEGK